MNNIRRYTVGIGGIVNESPNPVAGRGCGVLREQTEAFPRPDPHCACPVFTESLDDIAGEGGGIGASRDKPSNLRVLVRAEPDLQSSLINSPNPESIYAIQIE